MASLLGKIGDTLGKSTNRTTQTTTTRPLFDEQGQALLDALVSSYDQDATQTDYGAFFRSLLGPQESNPEVQNLINAIISQSDAAMPRELAQARSFTRNRPDTFANQTAFQTIAENRYGRDVTISGLLKDQFNIDRSHATESGLAGATGLAGLDANRFSQGAALLSMLRGEVSEGQSNSVGRDRAAGIGAAGGLMSSAKPK